MNRGAWRSRRHHKLLAVIPERSSLDRTVRESNDIVTRAALGPPLGSCREPVIPVPDPLTFWSRVMPWRRRHHAARPSARIAPPQRSAHETTNPATPYDPLPPSVAPSLGRAAHHAYRAWSAYSADPDGSAGLGFLERGFRAPGIG
jgi:hypothetical protein